MLMLLLLFFKEAKPLFKQGLEDAVGIAASSSARVFKD